MKNKRPAKFKPIKLLVKLCSFLVLVTICIDASVRLSTRANLYDDIAKIPHHKVGLVLGTAKYLSGNRINLFYQYRIDAAVTLFNAGKVDYLLVSGDNRTKYYNEAKTMQEDLLAAGIPKDRIVLDYAGLRTLDSVVRANKVFGQDSMTIISQQFHNERALFIANSNKIDAVAFNAKSPGINQLSVKVWLRERFARVKMFIDLFINKTPRHLGKPISIP